MALSFWKPKMGSLPGGADKDLMIWSIAKQTYFKHEPLYLDMHLDGKLKQNKINLLKCAEVHQNPYLYLSDNVKSVKSNSFYSSMICEKR